MTTTLSARQGLLTKACSRLTALLKNQEELLRQPEGSMAANSKILIQQFQKAKIAIADGINGVEQALEKYTSEADSLSVETPSFNDIMNKVVANSETAQDLLDKTQTRSSAISSKRNTKSRMRRFSMPKQQQTKLHNWRYLQCPFPNSMARYGNGNVLGSVQPLSALTQHGRPAQNELPPGCFARRSKKTVRISRTTYPAVISYLQEKYGDKQALLDLTSPKTTVRQGTKQSSQRQRKSLRKFDSSRQSVGTQGRAYRQHLLAEAIAW
ncbi:unnamed protein product [Nippostrongylus brasiliensis]|uniref:Uncharacterized protein n=1 Tax=Nippostrongylus brasiliensis TaxID=27835 RepID=A0A0N4YKA7_NIPBR|nr:unnamed protein product [Nippostrongylus brasiliensis]